MSCRVVESRECVCTQAHLFTHVSPYRETFLGQIVRKGHMEFETVRRESRIEFLSTGCCWREITWHIAHEWEVPYRYGD